MNLLENGSFRVYCTVYEYPQITRCYLTDFGHYSFCFLILFILYHYFKETGYGLLCMKP